MSTGWWQNIPWESEKQNEDKFWWSNGTSLLSWQGADELSETEKVKEQWALDGVNDSLG